MKKFSRTLTLGMGVVVALTLTACHPPHQKDSDTKIDNASTFTGEAPAQAEYSSTAAASAAAESGAAEVSEAAGASEVGDSEYGYSDFSATATTAANAGTAAASSVATAATTTE